MLKSLIPSIDNISALLLLPVLAFASNNTPAGLSIENGIFVDCNVGTIQRTIDGNIDDGQTSASSSSVCIYFGGGDDGSRYIDWYNSNEIAKNYPKSTFLRGSDPEKTEDGAAIHWAIEDDGKYIRIAAAARATGWLGIGIAEAGGMIGADMVLWEAANPDVLIDAYTTDQKFPLVDDCPGDWELVSAASEDGFVFFETRRLLDTGDNKQDRPIINDESNLVPPHRVIAAWGDTERVSFHGLNRARGSIRFFGKGGDEKATFAASMDRNAEGSFVVQTWNYEIPAVETKYKYTCIDRPALTTNLGLPDTSEKLYIIGFEPLVQKGNEVYVHHLTIYGYGQRQCPENNENSLGFQNEIPIYLYAPGNDPISFPDFLGLPFFGAGEFQSFVVEIHYNNPRLNEGVIDSSGVRLFWTSQSRDNDIGVLPLGDVLNYLKGQSVSGSVGGAVRHDFECPASCSSAALGNQSVTAFIEGLHMHRTGVRMTNEIIRDGEVVHTSGVDYFDFDQSGAHVVVQEPFTVKAGDSWRTTCVYDTSSSDRNVVFGSSSQQEMCIAVMYYYPRKTITINTLEMFGVDFGTYIFPWICSYDIGLDVCSAPHYSTNVSTTAMGLGRSFGLGMNECPETIVESLESEDGSGDYNHNDDGNHNDKSTASGSLKTTFIVAEVFLLWLLVVWT